MSRIKRKGVVKRKKVVNLYRLTFKNHKPIYDPIYTTVAYRTK